MRPVTNAVCIQRDFCPLCYRGGARPERVPRDSARIDAEQAACSRAFCGLPLLDLAAEGERLVDLLLEHAAACVKEASGTGSLSTVQEIGRTLVETARRTGAAA